MVRTARTDDTTTPEALFVALELSKRTWKLAFALNRLQRPRIQDVVARDLQGLLETIGRLKSRLGLPAEAAVKTCYEAGRDGFWIHRFLEGQGIENVVVDPASIEVNRRKRNVKTDRVDAQKLVKLLVRHHEGEEVLRTVRVPPLEAEDERVLPRLLKRLKNERTALTNAIRGALFLHGIDLDPRKSGFRQELSRARQWDGRALLPGTLRQVELHLERLELLQRQIKALEKEQSEALRKAARGDRASTIAQRKAARLAQLKGVGETGAYVLATELFGWREFDNRKQLGALVGLTGTPFSSGSSDRDQGISKAGNPRVRALLIQQAWGWLRHQPESALSHWYRAHVGGGGSRSKRKAIVALARKLLVELWHFVEHGVVPAGAWFQHAEPAKVAAA